MNTLTENHYIHLFDYLCNNTILKLKKTTCHQNEDDQQLNRKTTQIEFFKQKY